jgi:large subunit ribosomal protein L33
VREIVNLACGDCKRRNYSTLKNKKKTTDKLEFKKFMSQNHAARHLPQVGEFVRRCTVNLPLPLLTIFHLTLHHTHLLIFNHTNYQFYPSF